MTFNPEEFGEDATDQVTASGIYFLLYEGKLSYIGQSIQVMARISEHFRNWEKQSKGCIPVDQAYFVYCHPYHLTDWEGALIRVFQPPANKVKGKQQTGDQEIVEHIKRKRQRQVRGEEADRRRLVESIQAKLQTGLYATP